MTNGFSTFIKSFFKFPSKLESELSPKETIEINSYLPQGSNFFEAKKMVLMK